MKIFFTFLLLMSSFVSQAQWSNTTNQFYDSLHTPVCIAAQDQFNTRIVRSYPDSGYFVIWEDSRGGYGSPTQIFVQKYDKTGVQLWANDGVPVSSGTNRQHFTYSSNYDLRNYSIATTDNAGGLYIGYADDSVTNYVWERLMVQHLRSDGSAVFPGAGAILHTSSVANLQLAPQLIADGNGGFFISYLESDIGTMDLFVNCYKDINGTLKSYGGGKANTNGTEVIEQGQCGNYTTVQFFSAYVIDYKIYPDLQKGCNIAMLYSQNGGNPGDNRLRMAFNWLWRVKKDATTPKESFQKDNVELFYSLKTLPGEIVCGNEDNIFTYDTLGLLSNGLLPISDWLYVAERTRGTVVQTDGNINVNIVTVNEGNYTGEMTNWFTHAFYLKQQKFDSIPYEYTVSPYFPGNISSRTPPGQNKLGVYDGNYSDTLLYNAGANYYHDYCLASGGNKIFATAIIPTSRGSYGSERDVLLQQLKVEKITSDSFAVQLNTATENGIMIGRENAYIAYGNPQVKVDNKGNGLFYILERNRSVRVSPIVNGAELAWGAMGKPVGTGRFNGNPYTPGAPFIELDPLNGTGLLAWNDDRNPPYNGNNIYLRHLDNLITGDYYPPNHLVKPLVNPYGATTANPAVLLGTSKKFTTISAYSGYNGQDVTAPVVEISDNYNLGNVAVSVYENTGAIRTYNGQPYLDRNYNITPENEPDGTATINVRLYFTQDEFDALKAVDPSITSPGDLAVVKQEGTGAAPASYVFVAGDKTIIPQSWAAVPGGYYVEIAVKSFSNFFIQRISGALPLTWLNINAQWADNFNAKVSWQVKEQVNVKKYNLQHSYDGILFTNVCEVVANGSESYNCTVPAEKNIMHYYRVSQTDNDGKTSFSKVVILNAAGAKIVSVYPNPAADKMQLSGVNRYREFTIINAEGKLMMNGKLTRQSQSISVWQLQPGVYFIKLIGNAGVQTLKFIKK